MKSMTFPDSAARGLVAAAAGTVAMDVQQYGAYRVKGGTTRFFQWEFGGPETWDEASVPGMVGKKLIEAATGRELGPTWANLTNTVMHWGFGIQWGVLLGVAARSSSIPPLLLGPPFGFFVWGFGYTVLPLGHFYRPIWKYDVPTLMRDLSSHLVYGTTSGVVLYVMSRRRHV